MRKSTSWATGWPPRAYTAKLPASANGTSSCLSWYATFFRVATSGWFSSASGMRTVPRTDAMTCWSYPGPHRYTRHARVQRGCARGATDRREMVLPRNESRPPRVTRQWMIDPDRETDDGGESGRDRSTPRSDHPDGRRGRAVHGAQLPPVARRGRRGGGRLGHRRRRTALPRLPGRLLGAQLRPPPPGDHRR